MTNLKSILLMDLSELIFRLTITCEVTYDQRRMPAVARSMNERRMQTPNSLETIEHTENCERGVCVYVHSDFLIQTSTTRSIHVYVFMSVRRGGGECHCVTQEREERRTE